MVYNEMMRQGGSLHGIFKDFKRDFAQAVNELMPDKDELGAEYDDEDMVNTFDENDQMEVAPEDLLENLDEIRIDRPEPEMPEASENLEHFSNVETMEKDKTSDETSVFDTVPEAEVIQTSWKWNRSHSQRMSWNQNQIPNICRRRR